MDKKRLASGLLGFPLVVLLLLIKEPLIVDIALSLVAMIAMNEYLNAVSKISKPVKWIAYISCFSIALIHVIPAIYLSLIATLAIPSVLLILFLHIIVTNMKITFKDIAYTFLGIFYVVFFIMFIAFLNGMPNGKILIWYAIFAAWGTDIFAYFTGKAIGKHKFSKVSPKKSIEGCIGGIIGAVIMMLVYTFFMNKYCNMKFNYWIIGTIGVVLSIIGQIGDFSASSIKRYVDIKDYSNLIPGHGGMLDRIDSLIFIAPFAYAIFSIM